MHAVIYGFLTGSNSETIPLTMGVFKHRHRMCVIYICHIKCANMWFTPIYHSGSVLEGVENDEN